MEEKISKNLLELILDAQRATINHANAFDRNTLLCNAVEELGEYAQATAVESGRKKKALNETARQESVDVVICALSLFFIEGGNIEELIEYGNKKLKKWENNIKRAEIGHAIRQTCNHPSTTYYPDGAGGNDSWDECDVCGATV